MAAAAAPRTEQAGRRGRGGRRLIPEKDVVEAIAAGRVRERERGRERELKGEDLRTRDIERERGGLLEA